MPIFGGPVDILLVAGMLVAGVVVWLVRPRRRYPGPRLMGDHDEIDREALEAAEREVRDLGRSQEQDSDDDVEDDWGPGTARRPHLR